MFLVVFFLLSFNVPLIAADEDPQPIEGVTVDELVDFLIERYYETPYSWPRIEKQMLLLSISQAITLAGSELINNHCPSQNHLRINRSCAAGLLLNFIAWAGPAGFLLAESNFWKKFKYLILIKRVSFFRQLACPANDDDLKLIGQELMKAKSILLNRLTFDQISILINENPILFLDRQEYFNQPEVKTLISMTKKPLEQLEFDLQDKTKLLDEFKNLTSFYKALWKILPEENKTESIKNKLADCLNKSMTLRLPF